MAYTKEDRLMASYVMEGIGSFIIGMVIQLAHLFSFSAFAISLSFLIAVIFAAKISGAHLNGAVTIMLALNKIRTENTAHNIEIVFKYILAQIAGGLCAGVASSMLHGTASLVDITNTVSLPQAFVLEFIYTLILCTVVSILCCDFYKVSHDPTIIGALVAGSVFLASMALGDKTGGVINPSVGVSAILARALLYHSINLKVIWLYIFAPISGGVGAHLLYHNIIRPAFRMQLTETKKDIALSDI